MVYLSLRCHRVVFSSIWWCYELRVTTSHSRLPSSFQEPVLTSSAGSEGYWVRRTNLQEQLHLHFLHSLPLTPSLTPKTDWKWGCYDISPWSVNAAYVLWHWNLKGQNMTRSDSVPLPDSQLFHVVKSAGVSSRKSTKKGESKLLLTWTSSLRSGFVLWSLSPTAEKIVLA